MTARRAFWSVLATLPLILFVTTGCDLVFSLDAVNDVKDNALKCDCACTGGGSRTQMLAVGADDAEQAGATMDLIGTQLDLGTNIVGLRFDKLMIPHGATIQSARVQFASDTTDGTTTNLTIRAEASPAAAPFTTTANDLSGRTTGVATPVAWPNLPTWGAGQGNLNQLTPELNTIVQEAVDLDGWNNDSALVLIFQGSGHRAAKSFELSKPRAAVLLLTYDASVSAVLPICATAGITLTDQGRIPPETLTGECARVQTTFTNLAGACGFPKDNCSCTVVESTDPDVDNSFEGRSCTAECSHTAADATCSNFDPNGFSDCLADGNPLETCKQFVSATDTDSTTPDDTPVCVASGSPLAFHAYGHRSQCDVEGTADINVGSHEPTHDPGTRGRIEFLGANCPGPDCSISPYFDLNMDPITFSIRFHSDPTFSDLTATGRSFDVAPVDAGMATFGQAAVEGTANGRRGSGGKEIEAKNESDLDVGVDFAERTCTMDGNVAGSINQSVCDGDSSVGCTEDTDCDDAGVDGPCVEADDMTVNVALIGTLVNQPPTADGGGDETFECTSPAGADFLLDGRGSSDPDGDLALTTWRGGARNGPLVSNDIAPLASLGVGVTKTFVLRVIDTHAQTDDDTKTVKVVDTTAPVIACNAPATMRPPSKPVTFAATASDVCDASVPTAITAFQCFKLDTKNRITDKTKSCGLIVSGGSITVSNKAGVGDHVRWTVNATDDSGNSNPVTCEVVIVS